MDSQRSPVLTRFFAMIVFAMPVLALVWSVAQGAWADGTAPLPFVWRDIAIVHLVCAAPLAWIMGSHVQHWLAAAGCLALGVVAMGSSVALFEVSQSAAPGFFAAGMLRAVIALGFTMSTSLAMRCFASTGNSQGGQRGGMIAPVLALAALLAPPAAYVGARCRHDSARLSDLMDQGRIGEARAWAIQLAALDPQRSWRGRPLSELTAKLERDVAELEAEVALPLAANASAGQRFGRARQLAMLGKTDAALDALRSVQGPDADILRGTILEAREEWEPAIGAYRAAQAAWETQASSKARKQGLIRAATGIGYCQQKLGQYGDAEASFLQVLALQRSAEAHFLLAQFYRDTEEAEKARIHARLAIAMNPDHYEEKGEALIRKLGDANFGCLGVYQAESARPRPSLGGVGNP